MLSLQHFASCWRGLARHIGGFVQPNSLHDNAHKSGRFAVDTNGVCPHLLYLALLRIDKGYLRDALHMVCRLITMIGTIYTIAFMKGFIVLYSMRYI